MSDLALYADGQRADPATPSEPLALDADALRELVMRALAEDIGSGDITTTATVADDARARATIVQKAPGVIFGLALAEQAFRALDGEAQLQRLAPEGRWREDGPVLAVRGRARALLSAERTALNFLAHLSGIATLTARCVQAVAGTGARILDTRKTTPGLRALEKAAVRAGGGVNHRSGLYDAILIKENHIALAGGVGEAVRRALAAAEPGVRAPAEPAHATGRPAEPDGLVLEIECRTPAEIDQALAAGARRLLLDNMSPAELAAAVTQVGGRATLEASGGVTLETLPAIARSGVDFVSVGALTHSAPALDLSLSLEPLP